MGIEPTGRPVNERPDDFEDRGHHQVCKHFLHELAARLAPQTLGKIA